VLRNGSSVIPGLAGMTRSNPSASMRWITTLLPIAFALRTARPAIGYGIAGLTSEQILGDSRESLFPGGDESILRRIVVRVLQPALALSPAFQRMLAQPYRGLLHALDRRYDVVISEF